MSPEPTKIFDGEDEQQEESEFPIDPDEEEKAILPEPEKKVEPQVIAVPAEEQAGSSQREYVILKAVTPASAAATPGKGKLWQEVTTVTHSNGESAVRSLGEKGLEDGEIYRAVPVRNWDPEIPVKVKSTTTITLG